MVIGHLKHDASCRHDSAAMFADLPRVFKFVTKVFVVTGKRERHAR